MSLTGSAEAEIALIKAGIAAAVEELTPTRGSETSSNPAWMESAVRHHMKYCFPRTGSGEFIIYLALPISSVAEDEGYMDLNSGSWNFSSHHAHF